MLKLSLPEKLPLPGTLPPKTLLRLACLTLVVCCGCGTSTHTGSGHAGGVVQQDTRITVCLLPKIKGIPYFTSCAQGAQEAANELGHVELIYDGPTDGDAKKQAEMIEQWTVDEVDVICVAPNAPDVVANAMREARQAGVHVITWDADGVADARSLFVNQATPKQIGERMVDTMLQELGADAQGDVVIISSDPTSDNQNRWIEVMKPALASSRLRLATIKYPGENSANALADSKDVIKKYPDLKGLFGISSVAFPGAAEAVEQMGLAGQISVVGLSTPNDMRSFVERGTVKSVVLWNTVDLGYLTVQVADALARGRWKVGDGQIQAGRLGRLPLDGDHVLLGDALVFTQDNIDQFDF